MVSKFRLGSAVSVLALAITSNAAFGASLVAPGSSSPQEVEAETPALPDAKKAKTRIANQNKDSVEEGDGEQKPDIVVVGIRGSIDSALTRKRNSKQVVDSVVSEDAGKLPDNNVPEAISRIPGVNITRSQGQGGSITIRGLEGIQTTVNGQDVGVGDDRALNLSDIPAELIKSVDVYKSRGADQPEGGIGGTINVELRRPLDLRKGLLVAGSARGLYNDIVDSVTPYVSALVSYRFDTGVGEMGFLVNASYTKTRYAEALVQSESPFRLFGDAQASLPTDIQTTAIAPYRIQYGLNNGERTQPALTATYQWRPSDNLNFVLEGQYFGARSSDRYDAMSLQTREDYVRLSNVVTGPSGAIQSATYTGSRLDGAGNVVFGVPVFGFGGQSRGRNSTIIGNFETHWSGGIAHIDFTAQYQKFKGENYNVNFGQRYPQATVANVNFNDDIVPGGVPTFTLPGVDLTSTAQARLSNFGDRLNVDETKNLVLQLDTSLDLSETGFFRRLQIGSRYSHRDQIIQYGYRNVRFDNFPQPPFSALNIPTRLIAPEIAGQTPVSFEMLDSAYVFSNFATLRPQIVALNPPGFDGNGPQTSVGAFFASDRPVFDRLQGGTYTENNFAAYVQLGWAASLGFPAEGQFGLRYVNVYGGTTGARLVLPPNPDGSCCGTGVVLDNNSRANTVDLLPSASAVWHFTPKFQMRTAYNYNVQRPSFYSKRDTYIINSANPLDRVNAGNPDLRPIRDHNFNATLEWYPRAGMSVSLGAFYKKQTGFIYYTQLLEPVPPLNGAIRRVFRDRNAGPGKVLGFEAATTVPFYFLPGPLSGFGVSLNATYIPTATLSVPDDTGGNFQKTRSPFTSEITTNAVLFYEFGKISSRLAYQWRSQFKTGFDAINPGWVQIGLPQQRLDAAINYTPVPFMTLSIEGTNLTHSIDRYRYDLYPDLSVGLRSMARTIQGSVRFRF
jgi:TonB-dependent receptor